MKRKIAVLCGSDSDFPQISSGLAILRVAEARNEVEVTGVEVCSAHRNPAELMALLCQFSNQGVDVVIMCAGKLAALFGVADAISRNEIGNGHTVFVAVPLKGNTQEACQAAYLSVKQVPNSQFVFYEEFYQDPEAAFTYAVEGELPKVFLKEQKLPQSLSVAAAYHRGRRTYPEKADCSPLISALERVGFIHQYTGKTRETFVNPRYPDLLFVLATDRISIFDIVLNAIIPNKGAVLTAMTVHWLKNVFADVPNHLVAYGAGILEYLPSPMRGLVEDSFLKYLMQNMIVVQRTSVFKVEAIVRGHLTGSGLKDYRRTGKVCGIELPPGMVDGSELPQIIFTPSTKADYGQHDQNIDYLKAEQIIGEGAAQYVRFRAIELYKAGKETLKKSGIILADTKFEFGRDHGGNIRLIDEILTPDSSRFWPEEGWQQAMLEGKTPPSFDKQAIRDAGEAGGIKTTNPDWTPSEELIDETVKKYMHMVLLATGKPLDQFWKEEMGI